MTDPVLEHAEHGEQVVSRNGTTPHTTTRNQIDLGSDDEDSSGHISDSLKTSQSAQESVAAYFQSIDWQYPALASLRKALLGYLGEAEAVVRARINGQEDDTLLTSTDIAQDPTTHLDAAATSSSSGIAQDSSGLRRRGAAALKRRLSASLPSAATHLPSPEALLAHLSAIREDVISSLPSLPFPQIPFGLPLPRVVPGLLQSLPHRLHVLHENLPNLTSQPFDHHGYSSPSSPDEAPNDPDSLDAFGGLASRLSATNRKRIRHMIRKVLPSEDWPGWEKLGWEDYDSDEGEEDERWLSINRPALSRSRSHQTEATGSMSPPLTMGRASAGSSLTRHHPSSSESHVGSKSPQQGRSRKHSLPPHYHKSEMEEEPGYLFPNKTPAAALRRQQSYAAKREVRELRRRNRSASLSALSDHGKTSIDSPSSSSRKTRTRRSHSGWSADWGALRRTKSRDDGSVMESDPESSLDFLHSRHHHHLGDTGEYVCDTESCPGDLFEADELDEGGEGGGGNGMMGASGDEDDETEQELPVIDLGPTTHEALAKSRNGKQLIVFDDLPWWMRNNEYVIGGYRFIPLDAKLGPLRLIASAFRWHNETVNIHSHFIPSVLLFAFLIPYTLFNPPFHDPAPLDVLTLLAFLASASACLISSASWHTLAGCARRRLFEWGACVDYVGISWLISCSIHTVYYNAFYCQGRILLVYTFTTLASAIAGSIAPFMPGFNEVRNKNVRIIFFVAISMTALAPLTHLALQHGIKRGLAFSAPILPSIMSYIIGLVFYATHYPESKWPGRFDYIGHSHQIWHIAILCGIWFHYTGTLKIFEARHTLACAASVGGMGDPLTAGTGAPMSTYLRGWSKWLLPAGMIPQHHHAFGVASPPNGGLMDYIVPVTA